MLKLSHWKISLEMFGSQRHALRLSLLALAILFIHVNARAQGDFFLSVSPSSLTINPGASATATVTIMRNGFTGAVTLSAFEAVPAIVLPSGVDVTFNPATTTGTISVATITVPSSFSAGSLDIAISGVGGGLVRTTTLTINVTGVTITAVVAANGPWFNQEEIRISNASPLTSLSVTIVIQRTTGLSINAGFNTVGGQITQSVSTTPTTFVYQFNLAPGQTLQPGTNRVFAAQTNGTGTTHPTGGDTATVTYTVGGVPHTETRTF